MEITKYIKRLLIYSIRTKKARGRSLVHLIFKTPISKQVRKYLSMEAHLAFLTSARLLKHQISIRPRIKLVVAVVLILALTCVSTAEVSAYFKTKTQEIKVNGQPILVAATTAKKPNTEVEISGNVVAKAEPYAYSYPVDNGQISQGYSAYHNGFDIAAPLNTSIHPIGSGIVEFAGFVGDGHGNEVRVDHGDGLKTVYAHMNKINVRVGNMVGPTSTIGTIGLTGRTTGPHVHLEVWNHGATISPGSILPQKN